MLAEREDGRFELTTVGSFLKSGPGSFRAAAQLFGGPMVWTSWGDLLTTVRTGETALHRVFKTDSFEYFEHHPEEAAVFDEAMGSFTAMISIAVAAAYDFSTMRKLVDVGGGQGALLAGILRANPKLHGVVFDLPRLAEGARREIAAAGLADRCEFVGGDFFETVPSGADAYMLKHVIHDWDDAKATRILRTCRARDGPGDEAADRRGRLPAADRRLAREPWRGAERRQHDGVHGRTAAVGGGVPGAVRGRRAAAHAHRADGMACVVEGVPA